MTPEAATRLRIHDDASPATSERQGLRALELVGETPAAGDPTGAASLLRREAVNRRMLATADILSATLALIVVLSLVGRDRVGIAALAAMPLVLAIFKVAGLYDRDDLRLVHSTLEEVPVLLQLAGLFALGVTILQPLLIAGSLGGAQIAALWLGSFGAVMGGRVTARAIAARISPAERCLVIGEVAQVRRVRDKLATSAARAKVVASLPFAGDDADGAGIDSAEEMTRLASELALDRIIIAPTTTDAGDVVDLIRLAKATGVRVSVLPRMLEAVGSAVEFDDVDGLPMLGVRHFGLPRSSHVLKRAFDLALSVLGLLVVGPVIAAIAIAIKLDSKGPAFFRQTRVGRDGRHFRIYKFRSMVVDADARKDALRVLNEAGDGLFKIADDPRVTRVGRLLRGSSLDELPQIFNVLRGEMSLVGPRPLVTDEDARVLGLDRSRLHLTPGMTGPWQILGTRVPMCEMVGIDYLYVTNWSLWVDIKILLRTVRHVLRRGNV